MKLLTLQVTNFRSVDDSVEFRVDPVTCLVGKNEAGKSAILLALAALNPNEATPVELDKERDYPRKNLTRYKDLHPSEDALVIRTKWELEDGEVEAIADEIGEGVLSSPQIEVSRRYGHEIAVSAELDYQLAVEHHCKQFALNAAERSVLGSPPTTTKLIEALGRLQHPTEKHSQLQQYLSAKGGVLSRVIEWVTENLPSFMYVSSYDRMDGAIQIEETQRKIASQEIEHEENRGVRLFSEFLEYAGVAIDDIMNVSTYETFNARLQAASNNITEQILDYWTQNPDLDVEVRIEQARPGDRAPFNQGTIARARIKNILHRVDTPFSERSAGFVWFFSFLVKFAQVRNQGGPVILLLDEPGLSLHGKAQGDLLRFFSEKLAPFHQVIYSTHSPFMVPPNQFDCVRIVEDQVDERSPRRVSKGTRVSGDVLQVERDTLFPLQGALGYEITQSLFVGEHTLLVEGPSDILYLQALSEALNARGRTTLSPRWTLCPTGGIDKIMPFVSLFGGNALHVAVLSDMAAGDRGTVRRIKKTDILRAGHFYTVADFIAPEEGDIEDLFDPEVYAEIVNRTYGLEDPHRLTADRIAAEESSVRVVKSVEALFRVMPESIPMYNHFAPAAWLIRNPAVLLDESDAIERTISVAEHVFETYNALLTATN